MRICNYMKLISIMLTAIALLLPLSASGQNLDSALGQMKMLMGTVEAPQTAPETPQEPPSEPVVTGDPSSAPPSQDDNKPNKVDNSTCGPETVLPVEVCDLGQGLLCLNSPPFSVAGDSVIVHGTVDRRTSAFSHLKVFYQNDYTKVYNEVVIDSWASSDCWKDGWASSNKGCLDAKGYFGVKVPLEQAGPYTIKVDAVSLSGDAISKTVRSSRVVALKLAKEDITTEPDYQKTTGAIFATKIRLTADLLHGCTSCDFIGTSTGGVMITVSNMIKTPGGGSKTITRRSNVASAGKFDICVPVLGGTNELSVTACNAATGGENCQRVDGIKFEVNSKGTNIDIVSPSEDKLVYDAVSEPVIPLKFKVETYTPPAGGCQQGDVKLSWNKNTPVSLCPDADGTFSAQLTPEVGINAGTIEVKNGASTMSRSFIAAWGKKVNPYVDDNSGWIKYGLGSRLGSGYINDTLRPAFNNFLTSQNFKTLISTLLSATSSPVTADEQAKKDERKRKIDEIKAEIPHCKVGGGISGLKIQLEGEPQLKWGELERLSFTTSKMGFKLDIEGLEVHLKIFKDENNDGRPDGEVLPLLISIRGAQVDGRFEIRQGEKPLFLITSDHTDCDFQSSAYCEGKPTVLIPQNLVGGATRGGAFVRCDDKGQQTNERAQEECVALNIIGAQTGMLNQMVLDMINDLVYCQGSAFLTYSLREGMNNATIKMGCDRSAGDGSCGSVPAILRDRLMWISGGIAAAKGKVTIDENGIGGLIPARFGGKDALANLDSRVNGPDVGIMTAVSEPAPMLSPGGSDSISLSISADLINELLYELVFQKEGNGLLDWNVDEVFFKELGFDFVKQCDEFDSKTSGKDRPPVLCQLRPRVGELLGTALTTTGYFTAKDPVRMKLTGSRRIAPHLKVYQADVPYDVPLSEGQDEAQVAYRPAQILELQLPDIEVDFYALETNKTVEKDKYGNAQLALGTDGKPVVHSMIEGTQEPVPIIRVSATLLLPLEIGKVETYAADPSMLAVNVRPVPTLTKIIFKSIEGGNATIVEDESLVSAFKEKITYGIDIYGNPDKYKNPIALKIPKAISADFLTKFGLPDLFSKFGLQKIMLGQDGLSLGFDNANKMINMIMKPQLQ